ncbi:glycoside hydrolase domain-containing protein [Streptomyces sp. NPDC046821]|uniref:glycoside hydrolase domain-containing protein n=1 Tax=Streptomyces sp. NPDC046821 TaxID=3154702 RepID=UPI003403BDE2
MQRTGRKSRTHRLHGTGRTRGPHRTRGSHRMDGSRRAEGSHRSRGTVRRHRHKLLAGLVMLLTALSVISASAWADPVRRDPDPTGETRDGLLGGLDLSDLGLAGPALGEPAPGPEQARASEESKALLPSLSGARMFRGYAFDTCTAPPLDTMRRWQSSKYGAVGVYYGGRGRACPDQPSLDRTWTREVHRLGWRILPVYVGSQSPCVTSGAKKAYRIGSKPVTQGMREGQDAVSRAEALGIRPGSPLYLDMEAYKYQQEKCAETTLAFVRGWDRQVREEGYVPGFYSSADSGVQHMRAAASEGVQDLPSVIWFARWHTQPRLAREPLLQRSVWTPERRIHQYAGNVKERHGGRTLVIDRNLVHAPVARIG